MIVVDTNVIAAFCSQSNGSKIAEQVLMKDSEWHAPLLWLSEFRNVLILNYRRGLSSLEVFGEALEEAKAAVPLERTHAVQDERVLELAIQSGCTAYDCEFVAVAEELGVKLVTWDKQLLKQFPEKTIRPEDFLNLKEK